MTEPNQLPHGWISVVFNDVLEINPAKKVTLNPNDLVTFLPMAAISEITGSIVNRQSRPLHEVNKGFTQFAESDVLFAKITPSMENGKSAVATNLENGIGFGSTEFHVLRSNGKVLPAFVWNFVRRHKFRMDAQKVMSGAVGQQRVPASYLKTQPLALPPLAEQKRIVDKLSSLFEKTERARLELSRIPQLITKLKAQLIHRCLIRKVDRKVAD